MTTCLHSSFEKQLIAVVHPLARLSIYIAGLCLYASTLNGQVCTIDPSRTQIDLYDYFLIHPDTTALSLPNSPFSLTDETFIPLSDYETPLKHEQDYWLRLDVVNTPNKVTPDFQEWVLRFSLTFTDIEYFVFNEVGELTQQGNSGFFKPVSERAFVPIIKGNFASINLPAGTTSQLYIRLRTDRLYAQPDFRTELIAMSTFYDQLQKQKLRNGIFLGFILLMLIYNLFLFFQVKDHAYIFYSIYLFALLFYVVYNTGDLANWLTPWLFPNNPQFIYIGKLSAYFIIFAYISFLRVFLDMSTQFPRWHKVFQWFYRLGPVVVIADLTAMLITNFSYDIPDVLLISYVGIFLLLIFTFLPSVWRWHNSTRHFIAWGMVAMGTGALISLIARLQSIDFSTAFLRGGIIIEVIIFSLGLAYRQRENERQRQEDRFAAEKFKLKQQENERELQRLFALDEAKSQFYTQITHEFRTPLTVIDGLARHLQQTQKHDGESLSLILRNNEALLQQINQLLDLAKLQNSQLSLDCIHGEVNAYLSYLTESFYSLAEERKLRLVFYAEEDEIWMDYDELKLQQIIYNLLSNALKFTPSGGKVVLHSKRIQHESLGETLQIKVVDNGIGIPKTDLSEIFNRFQQADNKPVTSKYRGTGIGLTLTKQLVEISGGQIQAISELEKGSEFIIHLPIRQDYKEQEIASNQRKPAVSSVEDNGALTDSRQASTGDTRPLLLLVEDNTDIVLFLQKILSSKYQLLVANNGQQGLSLAIAHVPDIIVSDVMMPIMDGFTLTEQLKADVRTSHIPLILLTAKADQPSKLTGLRVGADAYLMKPFSQEELFIRLAQLIKNRQALQQYYQQWPKQTDSIPTEQAREHEFIQKVSNYIKEKITEPELMLEDVAQHLHLSYSQLYRKLKALTGTTPKQFIKQIRMERAVELLQREHYNVSEVAYQVGFNDPNYFTRVFQRHFGHPPSHFRQSK